MIPMAGQKDKDDGWLGCDAMYFSREASILWMNLLLPSSG